VPDADRERRRELVARVEGCNTLIDAATYDRCGVRIAIKRQHGEFIASQSRDNIRITHGAAQQPRHGAQRLIASGVAKTIVHLLESIEVGKEQHQIAPLTTRNPQLLFSQREKSATIVEAREFVGERRATQILFFLFAGSNVTNRDGNSAFNRHCLMPQPGGCKASG